VKVLDLFSGIGGFSLGLERAGFKTVAFCEKLESSRKVLRKHWPKVKIYEDITSARFKENVDLVTAGFPCQDISFAGDGAGLTGDRSGLFWYILRTLCMVGRPRVLLENVAGLLIRGMGEVLGALASFGYDTEWNCIPAGAVGAPHRRDRVWISAHDRSKRKHGIFLKKIQEQPEFSWCKDVRRVEDFRERPDLYPPTLCRKINGISNRLDACGNAVVPQIPEIIGRAIMKIESSA
jgi:DNA (cytosine-5)-methyltransferase 1